MKSGRYDGRNRDYYFQGITLPAGVWAFKQAENYAKRTGKLKRVG